MCVRVCKGGPVAWQNKVVNRGKTRDEEGVERLKANDAHPAGSESTRAAHHLFVIPVASKLRTRTDPGERCALARAESRLLLFIWSWAEGAHAL